MGSNANEVCRMRRQVTCNFGGGSARLWKCNRAARCILLHRKGRFKWKVCTSHWGNRLLLASFIKPPDDVVISSVENNTRQLGHNHSIGMAVLGRQSVRRPPVATVLSSRHAAPAFSSVFPHEGDEGSNRSLFLDAP